MRSKLVAIVLVGIVVLSGCSSLTGGDGTSPTDTSMNAATDTVVATEQAVTRTPTPTAEPTRSFPGIESGTLTNVSKLSTAHSAALAETGYALSFNYEVAPLSDDHAHLYSFGNMTLRETADGTFSSRSVTNSSGFGNKTIESWGNQSVAVRKRVSETFGDGYETAYEHATRPSTQSVAHLGSYTYLMLQIGSWTVESSAEVDGTSRYTLALDGVNQSYVESNNISWNISTIEGSLVVDEQGRIHSLQSAMIFTEDDSEGAMAVSLQVSYSLDAVGDVTVSKPPWVSEAVESMTFFDATVTAVDGTFVKLTNDGPDAIPAGATVTLWQDDSGSGPTIQDAVEPGETIWIYKPVEGYQWKIAREQPADGQSLSGNFRVVVKNGFTNTLFEGTVEFDEDE